MTHAPVTASKRPKKRRKTRGTVIPVPGTTVMRNDEPATSFSTGTVVSGNRVATLSKPKVRRQPQGTSTVPGMTIIRDEQQTTPFTVASADERPSTAPSSRQATKTLPEHSVDHLEDRLIARIRTWDPTLTRKDNGKQVPGSFGTWADISEKDLKDPASLQERCGTRVAVVSQGGKTGLEISLRRGGKVTYFPRLLDEPTRARLSKELEGSKAKSYFTEYAFGSGNMVEPRLHFLASSEATADESKTQPAYKYHGVVMRAKPLGQLPHLSELSKELAEDFDVPGKDFNIGVDVIIFRDGKDHINWHADDTQGESVIISITVDSPNEPRKLRVRVSGGNMSSLVEGDEELELCLGAGDGYVMDSTMQKHYEHQVPKSTSAAKRTALIFREGDKAFAEKESTSTKPGTLEPPNREVAYVFGDMGCLEKGTLYSRGDLLTTKAHCCDRGGVSGNSTVGADAIIVKDVDLTKRELDFFVWLLYSAPTKSKCGALFTSFMKGRPVRVFRSSSSTVSPFRPPRTKKTRLRYDGLYKILCVWDEEGNKNPPSCPSHSMYTFLLHRQRSAEALSNSAYVEQCVSKGVMVEDASIFFQRLDGIPSLLGPLPPEVLPPNNSYKLRQSGACANES